MLHMLLKAGEEEGQVNTGRDQSGGVGISMPLRATEGGSHSHTVLLLKKVFLLQIFTHKSLVNILHTKCKC